MKGIFSPFDVGMVLQKLSLEPTIEAINMYRISYKGERMYVHTDRLPEIYIERPVHIDRFNWENNESIMGLAISMVNDQRQPVRVYWLDEHFISFMLCIEPESADSLLEQLPERFVQMEQAAEAVEHAYEGARHYDIKALLEQLAIPSPDNPWTKGKKLS